MGELKFNHGRAMNIMTWLFVMMFSFLAPSFYCVPLLTHPVAFFSRLARQIVFISKTNSAAVYHYEWGEMGKKAHWTQKKFKM